MPGNDEDIDADPLNAAVTTEIRTPDGFVIPAGTVVTVHLTTGLPRVYDPRTGVHARVPLILLDPDIYVHSGYTSTRNHLSTIDIDWEVAPCRPCKPHG